MPVIKFDLTDEQKEQAKKALDARFVPPAVENQMLFTTGLPTVSGLGGDTTGLVLNYIKAIPGLKPKMDGHKPRRAFGADAPDQYGEPIYGTGGYKFEELDEKGWSNLLKKIADGKLVQVPTGTQGSVFNATAADKVEAAIKAQIEA